MAKGPEQRVQSKECKAKRSDIKVEERSNALHTRPSKSKDEDEDKDKDKDKINFSRINYGKISQDGLFTHRVWGAFFGTPYRPIYDRCWAANIHFA